MLKTKFRFSLFFFLLVLLTVGNYANADTITEITSTYLGESGNDYGYGIAVDKDGYIYVVGVPSFDYGFIAKFNPDCSKVEYYSSFEGKLIGPTAITVDENNRVYITGGAGPGLPVTPNPNYSGNGDGFLMIVSPDGVIEYCSYFGGEAYDCAFGIAVDKNGYIYATGYTKSFYFPVFNAPYPEYGGGEGDAFVMKFYPGGASLVYSTFLGGSNSDKGNGIAADKDGNAYVTGWTESPDFPVTSEPYYNNKQSRCVFVVKLDFFGSLSYSICLGVGTNVGHGIAVDENGSAYVTGFTWGGFPVTNGAYDEFYNGNQDMFACKVNSTGTALDWSTLIGGSYSDGASAIGIDRDGNVYVTGATYSDNCPVTSGAYDPSINGDRSHWMKFTADIFLIKLSPDGKRNLYSTYFGGSADELAYAIAVDKVGDVYITGETASSEFDGFPVTPGAYDTTHNGKLDAFATKFFLSRLTGLTISSGYGGTTNPAPQEKDAYNYNKGTWVQIEAIPDSGYRFSYWTGDVPAGQENDNPLILTMDSDKSIIANFVRQYKLTLTSEDGGTTDPAPGTHTYDSGTKVSIKAIPSVGYQFSKWSGDASGEDNPITIVMYSDKSITAHFKSGCFIATAAYGSLLHPHVQILRDFRDKYLMTSSAGRKFVELYYKYSPFVAKIIAKHKTLKAIIRIGLLPLVTFSYSILQ